MKSLTDNVMSSLGLQGQRGPKVDPVAAMNKVKSSKKDLKAKAYKAALLDLLYLQATTGQIPGLAGLGEQGMTGGYPQMMPPGGVPMPQMGSQFAGQMAAQMGGGQMPSPQMMAGMGAGVPQGMMG